MQGTRRCYKIIINESSTRVSGSNLQTAEQYVFQASTKTRNPESGNGNGITETVSQKWNQISMIEN